METFLKVNVFVSLLSSADIPFTEIAETCESYDPVISICEEETNDSSITLSKEIRLRELPTEEETSVDSETSSTLSKYDAPLFPINQLEDKKKSSISSRCIERSISCLLASRVEIVIFCPGARSVETPARFLPLQNLQSSRHYFLPHFEKEKHVYLVQSVHVHIASSHSYHFESLSMILMRT